MTALAAPERFLEPLAQCLRTTEKPVRELGVVPDLARQARDAPESVVGVGLNLTRGNRRLCPSAV